MIGIMPLTSIPTASFVRQVLVLCLMDAAYYLPCMLVLLQSPHLPVLYLTTPMDTRLVYPHCREAMMAINLLWHGYIARVMYQWVVLKASDDARVLYAAPSLLSCITSGYRQEGH
jgi:hypothetical protein